MNFNNNCRYRGYVRQLKFDSKGDHQSLLFTLFVKRDYPSMVDGEKKYVYDQINCRATGKRASILYEKVKEGMYVEISGATESFKQSIQQNRLVTYTDQSDVYVVRHSLNVESFNLLESLDTYTQRMEKNKAKETSQSAQTNLSQPARSQQAPQEPSQQEGTLPQEAYQTDYASLFEGIGY